MDSGLLSLCDHVQDSGIEKLLYVVLGAVLALLGGFFTEKYRNHILKGREDRELLLKALDNLIELEPVLNGIASTVPPSDLVKPCKELWSYARRIQTKRYYGIAERLIEFALKKGTHTKDESDKLISEIAEKISKPYFGYYGKEKEFFRKVTQEMREGLERENKGREKKKGE